MKVELPIVTFTSRPRDKRSGKRSLRKDKRTADIRLESVKVLAVDDNSDSRVLLKEILECSSAEATVVSSGQEALAAFNNVHPDILVCDLAMPEMNGYELLKNIRSLGSSIGQIPAIAFTAAARTEDRAATRQAGFEAHLSKPVDPDALISTILELTGKHMGQHMRS
jgi:CheY-like chemotaxis protein